MSASDVAAFLQRDDPSAYADLSCKPDHSSGWDYVCMYTDPELGREKLGVTLVLGGKAAVPSGSTQVNDVMPDGPHRKNTDADFARRASALCAKRAAAVQALPVARNQTELLDHGELVKELEAGEWSRLADINPPADERTQVAAFVKSLETLPRRIETLRDGLLRRDAAAVLSADRDLKAARERSTSLARGLGLNCRY
jgi:hypothetical protein